MTRESQMGRAYNSADIDKPKRRAYVSIKQCWRKLVTVTKLHSLQTTSYLY